jgi:hypothetical protein
MTSDVNSESYIYLVPHKRNVAYGCASKFNFTAIASRTIRLSYVRKMINAGLKVSNHQCYVSKLQVGAATH